MKTPQEYIESLRKLDLVVYQFGKRIQGPVDDPIIRPSMNAVALTYSLAMKPEYEEIMTATSHITGEEDQPLHPHPPEHGRPGEEEQDGEAARLPHRVLLPAVRGHGRAERPLHHDVRH